MARLQIHMESMALRFTCQADVHIPLLTPEKQMAGVRPEDMEEGGELPVEVFSNENLGMNTLVHGHLLSGGKGADRITCKLRGWCDYKAGDRVPVSFVRRHFFDKDTTNAIRGEA